MTDIRSTLRILVIATAVLAAPFAASAQQPKSAALATELAKMLDQAKLDSIAGRLGGAEDQWVGALYFPGSQLLVVSAKYSAPQRLAQLLGDRSYRDIYIDLNSASIASTKVFISDLGVNGLQSDRDGNDPYDTVDAAGKSYAFDGDWKKVKMTEAEYMKAYATYDEQYAQMLQSLIAQLRKTS